METDKKRIRLMENNSDNGNNEESLFNGNNLIDSLLNRGLDLIVAEIFLNLNSRDLKSIFLTCKKWNEFANRFVRNSVSGRR